MKIKRFLVASVVGALMVGVPASAANAHVKVKCPKGQKLVTLTVNGVNHAHCVNL